MFRFILGTVAFLLFLSMPMAAGSLTMNLDDSVLYTPPGGIYQSDQNCQNQDGNPNDCVIFTGEISTSDTSQNYYLDSLTIAMDPSNPDGGADVNDNTYQNETFGNYYFFNATSGVVLGQTGQLTYTGGLFEIDVTADAPSGNYFGTATLNYSDDNGDCGACTVSENFEVVVTPEPDAWLLSATGLAAVGFLRRRRVRRAR